MTASLKQLAKEKGLSAEEIRKIAATVFASHGGKAGTGKCKRRPKAHYAKMVAARNAQREAAKAAKELC